jgi:hypothetical protein
MGLITKSFVAENDLTIFTVTGEVTAQQILDQILAFLNRRTH